MKYMRNFSAMGKKGGAARAKALTPRERRAIARIAGLASAAARRASGKGKKR